MKVLDPPIIVEEVFESTLEKIWEAISEVGKMQKWYFPHLKSFKAEDGFYTEFLLENEGRAFTHQWTILEVIPNRLLKYRWKFKEYDGDSVVSFVLKEEGPKVRLTVTSEIIDSFPKDIPEFKRESGIQGWNYLIKQSLKEYLKND